MLGLMTSRPRLSDHCIRAYVPDDIARQVDEAVTRTGETRSSWLRRLVVAAVRDEAAAGAAEVAS